MIPLVTHLLGPLGEMGDCVARRIDSDRDEHDVF